MKLIAVAVPLLAIAGAAGFNQMNQAYPYWTLFQPHDSKPNTPLHRGGYLEPIRYFEGKLEKGKPASLKALARHGPGNMMTIEVELREAGTQETPTGPLPIFEARYGTQNLCEGQVYDPERVDKTGPHPELTGKAIAVPGYWDGMTWRDRSESSEVFTVACLSGAIAKCAYWGYLPGANYTKDNKEYALEPFHHACVKALRAEYDREDSTAYTCVGTAVDIYDRLGILKKTQDQGFEFESQWAATGPVCRKRSRMVGDDRQLTALGASAQEDCAEPTEHGWKEGALIAIASRTTNRRPDTGEDSCPTLPPSAQASR